MRHTFKANCLAADVNPQLTASIAGWTGSVVNEIMLNYGSEGLSNSEIVRSLTDAQRKIHHHLLSSDVCQALSERLHTPLFLNPSTTPEIKKPQQTLRLSRDQLTSNLSLLLRHHHV